MRLLCKAMLNDTTYEDGGFFSTDFSEKLETGGYLW